MASLSSQFYLNNEIMPSTCPLTANTEILDASFHEESDHLISKTVSWVSYRIAIMTWLALCYLIIKHPAKAQKLIH